jgi:hypothetical protein
MPPTVSRVILVSTELKKVRAWLPPYVVHSTSGALMGVTLGLALAVRVAVALGVADGLALGVRVAVPVEVGVPLKVAVAGGVGVAVGPGAGGLDELLQPPSNTNAARTSTAPSRHSRRIQND